eukprot:TRINITY_DN1031_c1_g1_i1.p1 TRINITY_DN1031_c1_g1~~TRINITY_DN1031_c1_g1_i1.p1  ORF type:complete len:100 (-),score=48.12 TRINITY_DN1031_c1_g1_i1:24-323(-)
MSDSQQNQNKTQSNNDELKAFSIFLDQVQSKFEQMSIQILGKIEQMNNRIGELENTIQQLSAHANIDPNQQNSHSNSESISESISNSDSISHSNSNENK